MAWREDGFFIRPSQLAEPELVELRAAAEKVADDLRREISGQPDVSLPFEDRIRREYVLDGNRFVDINYLTLQYEHLPGSEQLRVVEPVHELDARLSALVADSRLVEPMRELVGAERIGLWTAKLNFKAAQTGSGFRWHQDSPYWIHSSDVVDQLPNVFVAFDDADKTNGGLRLIRGSHKQGVLPGRADGSQLEGFFTHPDAIDDRRMFEADLPAGTLLFFSPHIIHGSAPNQSNASRRALIVTYQPAGLAELKSGQVGPAL